MTGADDEIPPPPPRLERDRDHRNQYQSPRNQPQRDAWAAARWTLNRWTYQEIATALGLSSKSSGHDAVQRGLHAIQQQTDEEISKARAVHRARLGYALEVATEVMSRDHVHVSQGRVMKDDEGLPLIDDGPKLAAADRVRSLSESLRKLDGLDAPQRHELSMGDIDAALADTAARLALARSEAAETDGTEGAPS